MSKIPIPLFVIGLFACLAAPAMAQDRPAEAFCLPGERSEPQVCVALFLDEDGYEVCLSDMEAGTERCFSLYQMPPTRESEREPDVLLGSASPELLPI